MKIKSKIVKIIFITFVCLIVILVIGYCGYYFINNLSVINESEKIDNKKKMIKKTEEYSNEINAEDKKEEKDNENLITETDNPEWYNYLINQAGLEVKINNLVSLQEGYEEKVLTNEESLKFIGSLAKCPAIYTDIGGIGGPEGRSIEIKYIKDSEYKLYISFENMLMIRSIEESNLLEEFKKDFPGEKVRTDGGLDENDMYQFDHECIMNLTDEYLNLN